jgi:hypothetical protein
VVSNNEEKTTAVATKLIARIVGAEWFRCELQRDYEKILEKWLGLESECFHLFVQAVCKAHAELTLETEFSKKYSQVSTINFEKEVRAAISFYERYSHSILPHFKTILDYIEILRLENEDDFRDIVSHFRGTHSEADLRKVWALRQ